MTARQATATTAATAAAAATATAAAKPTPADAHGPARTRGEARHAKSASRLSRRKAAQPRAQDGHESSMAREQRIRELAYAHYVARGGADGQDLDDWLKAEAQVG